MKKKLILAALVMSMAVTVFAEEELIWEEQTATETVTYAESVFEDDVSVDEQTASEEPEYVFEETVEGQTTDEDVVSEEIAFDENVDQAAEVVQEESVLDELVVTEETASAADAPQGNEGLVYTGEPQALITPQPGDWLYSLDGETYSSDLPMGLNAGTYTVYMKDGENVATLTVTIAKADVIITPPVANTTNPSEVGEPENTGEEPAVFADLVERVE